MVDFVLQMSDLGTPVRMKDIPSIALSVTRGRPEPDRPLKSPGKNWAKSLEKRHSELEARKIKALNWDRHEKNIFSKNRTSVPGNWQGAERFGHHAGECLQYGRDWIDVI
jgi:hypothetical protein